MTNLQKLIDFLSDPAYSAKYTNAKNIHHCVVCEEYANKFSTKLAEFEYQISALCERCQETYYK